MAQTKVKEILQSDESNKEKFDYLWGYYKTHVIITILALLFGGYLFVDWLNRPVTYFHVTVLAPEVMQDEEEPLSRELTEILNPQEPNDTVYASFTPHGQMAERFSAQFTAAEYDVILMDEFSFSEYSEYETMQEFRIEGMDEEDYYGSDMYDNPIGIDSSHFPIFDNYTTTQDLIVVIPGNTTRPALVEEFFADQGLELDLLNN